MRVQVIVNDELMGEALAETGLKTQKAVVEEGLRTLLRLRQQTSIRELRGTVKWDND